MSIAREFREFAMRGNVIDMAVGVVIGAAFGKIVSSLVADIVMPPLGLVLGNVDFTNLFLTLGGGEYATLDAAREAGAPTLNYGIFLSSVIDFLLVALAIFAIIKVINRMRRSEKPAPETTPTMRDCPECLSEIPGQARRCRHCSAAVTA